MTQEEMKTAIDEKVKSIKEKVDNFNPEQVKNIETDIEGFKKSVGTLGDDVSKSLSEYAKDNAKAIADLETQLKEAKEQNFGKSIGFSQAVKGDLKEALKEGKETFLKKARSEDGIEVAKSATTIQESNNFTNTYYNAIEDDPLSGVSAAPRPPLTIWDLINKKSTGKRYITYTTRSAETNGITMVDEGVSGGQSDVSFEDKIAKVKKLSGNLDVSMDSLDDIDYLDSEIRDVLRFQVMAKANKQVIEGDGTFSSGGELRGLINDGSSDGAIAKTFSKPTGYNSVSSPNMFDAFIALLTQVKLGQNTDFKYGYLPTAIVINPVDMANLMHIKDSNGNSLVVRFAGENYDRIAGIPVVESPYMTPGTVLAGDFSRAEAFVRKGYTLRVLDQNGTNGESDILTMVVSMRTAFLVREPHEYAFAYGTFDNIITAITA